jgi:hypothetical protein
MSLKCGISLVKLASVKYCLLFAEYMGAVDAQFGASYSVSYSSERGQDLCASDFKLSSFDIT